MLDARCDSFALYINSESLRGTPETNIMQLYLNKNFFQPTLFFSNSADTNIRYFVIVPQIPKSRIIYFQPALSLLFGLGNFIICL